MERIIVLGAGCFWGVEENFRSLNGVINTQVGYAGGHTKNPTYEDVCSTDTNHAEVVKVVFENKQISLEQILEFFFKIHNPTQINRQGVDIGSQYRSVIYVANEKELQQAENFKIELQEKIYGKKIIATEIAILPNYYKAEAYHQQYIQKNNRMF